MPTTRVRTLAVWSTKNGYGENFEYALEGTPCDEVIGEGRMCFHREGLSERFPREAGWEAFLGLPIIASDGRMLGHLAFFDSRPLGDEHAGRFDLPHLPRPRCGRDRAHPGARQAGGQPGPRRARALTGARRAHAAQALRRARAESSRPACSASEAMISDRSSSLCAALRLMRTMLRPAGVAGGIIRLV